MARRGIAGAALALIVAVLPTVVPPQPARADDDGSTQADLIRRVLPTVVNITAHVRPPPGILVDAAAPPEAGDTFDYMTSAGSGFVVDPDGTILSNWHVVAGAFEIFVTFSDGSRLDAEVVNAARIVDLVLLKVTADHELPAVTWGDADRVRIGDSVLAIGNPLGIGTSVTRGIVSALHRNINDTPIDDFIQTDAAINHGNSGGPLFNMKGEVIGVDSAIISPTAASAGLGFALPAYQAQFMIEQLKKYGWIRPGWLGLKAQDVTPDIARAIGLSRAFGAIVDWLAADGPGERAGLRVGDVIVRFDDDAPGNERALLRDITGSWPGRTVTLGVIRDGRALDLRATLDEWPRTMWEGVNAPLKVAPPHWTIPADLGIRVTELTPELLVENGMPPGLRGALVTEVARGTDAARRGLVAGDVIMQVGKVQVDTPDTLQAQIDAVRRSGNPLANLLVFPRDRARTVLPSPKWLPLRVAAG